MKTSQNSKSKKVNIEHKALMKHFEEMFFDQILVHRENVIVNVNVVKQFKTWLNNRLLKLGSEAENENIHTDIKGGITKRIKTQN